MARRFTSNTSELNVTFNSQISSNSLFKYDQSTLSGRLKEVHVSITEPESTNKQTKPLKSTMKKLTNHRDDIIPSKNK
ncbi:unnamed protein product, partial [Adineta steineri]